MTLEEAEERIQTLERDLVSTKESLSTLVSLLVSEDDEEMDPLEAAHQTMLKGLRSEREGSA